MARSQRPFEQRRAGEARERGPARTRAFVRSPGLWCARQRRKHVRVIAAHAAQVRAVQQRFAARASLAAYRERPGNARRKRQRGKAHSLQARIPRRAHLAGAARPVTRVSLAGAGAVKQPAKARQLERAARGNEAEQQWTSRNSESRVTLRYSVVVRARSARWRARSYITPRTPDARALFVRYISSPPACRVAMATQPAEAAAASSPEEVALLGEKLEMRGEQAARARAPPPQPASERAKSTALSQLFRRERPAARPPAPEPRRAQHLLRLCGSDLRKRCALKVPCLPSLPLGAAAASRPAVPSQPPGPGGGHAPVAAVCCAAERCARPRPHCSQLPERRERRAARVYSR